MSLHCLPRIERVGLTAAGLTVSTWRQIPGLTSSTWRQISTSSNYWVRGRNSSFRFRRRGGSTVVLLDQFIKQTNVDGSLVAKAPFSISCSASYFDPDHNVDEVKNKEISESRDQFFKEERDRRREESRYRLENKLLNSPGSQAESSERFKPLPDNGAGLFLQTEDLPSGREINEVEQRILDQLTGSSQDHDHQALLKRIQSRTRTPLHFKLFGKSNIRVDSYSIIRARAHSSHIYISDVGSVEEAVGMMTENGENGEVRF
ncbi:uncharacterized protein LOC111716635 [Eurytemora carolleeae]|uniref:uncharacterized protein LOC111716635 n=1 Tax=Eurytemora carolleeae TaxID=1294199 RepID=UPI000C766165|nr:uncharacterized protein LOC111716635 [Eurytemora carolleeae]|eukprot:XP_023347880.1 uncharacterized protein LOC111716635 [Eurytemora affinis]